MIPLEREYEGWIMRDIDDYFREIGVPHTQAAVSPIDERTWPADEFFQAHGKLLALQFKRPDRRAAGTSYWKLGNPPHQLPLIQKHPEIYYALPHFFSRDHRRMALYHTYFWRPGPRHRHAQMNPDESWIAGRAHSWGTFIAAALRCDIGNPYEMPEEGVQAARQLLMAISAASPHDMPSRYDGDPFSVEDAPALDGDLITLVLTVPQPGRTHHPSS